MANIVQIVIKGIDQTKAGFNAALNNLDGWRKAADSMAAVSAGALVAAAGSLALITRSAINGAEEMGRLAAKAGIAVEPFSRLAHAASLSNVSVENLSTGINFLNKSLVEAAGNPASEAARAFATMGVSITDASGKLRAQDAVLLDVADQFNKYADGADKAALAMAVFGRGGAEMIPLLNEGGAAIRKMGDETEGVSSQMAKQSDEFNDNLLRLKASAVEMGRTLAAGLLPHLLQFTDWIVKTQRESGAFNAIALTIVDTFRAMWTGASNLLTALRILGALVGSVLFVSFNNVRLVLVAVRDLFVNVGETIGKVMSSIWGVVKAFGELGTVMGYVVEGQFEAAAEAADKAIGTIGDEVKNLGGAFKDGFSNVGKIVSGTMDKASGDAVAAFKTAQETIKREALNFRDVEFGATPAKKAVAPEAQKESVQFRKEVTQADYVDDMAQEKAIAARFAALEKLRALSAQMGIEKANEYAQERLRSEEEFFLKKGQIEALAITKEGVHLLTEIETNQAIEQARQLHEKKLTDIQKKEEAARKAIQMQRVATFADGLGMMGNAAAAFGKKGFEVAKGLGIAQAIVDTYVGANKALAQGGFFGAFMATAVVAMGMANVARIASTNYGGQAHAGLDYVPSEGTYLLNKGEAVIQPEANEDLRDFLSGNGGGGASSPVNLILDGEVIGRIIGNWSRDGRLELDARSIVG